MGFLEYAFKSEAGVILIVNRGPAASEKEEELDVYVGPLNKLQKYNGDFLFSKTPKHISHKDRCCGIYIAAINTDDEKLGALIWDFSEQAEMYYDDGHAERLDRIDPRELPGDIFAQLKTGLPARKRPRLRQAASAKQEPGFFG